MCFVLPKQLYVESHVHWLFNLKKKNPEKIQPPRNPEKKPPTPSPQTNTYPKITSELQVTLTKM